MSEELNAGVKIFLERCKSNPDEVLEDYGKWEGLVSAVFAYVEEGRRQSVLRGLTDEEIRTLFETLNGMYREKFASRIMGHVLRGDAEESPQREFVYAASQGKLPPGSWQNVAVGTSSMSIEDQVKIAMRPKVRMQGSRGGE